jgi:hypothetical protein
VSVSVSVSDSLTVCLSDCFFVFQSLFVSVTHPLSIYLSLSVSWSLPLSVSLSLSPSRGLIRTQLDIEESKERAERGGKPSCF